MSAFCHDEFFMSVIAVTLLRDVPSRHFAVLGSTQGFAHVGL